MSHCININVTYLNLVTNSQYLNSTKIFYILGLNCTPPAIDDFPKDLFTEKQRQGGAVALHALASLYLFVALAVVCDKYFVPAVEKICHGKYTRRCKPLK